MVLATVAPEKEELEPDLSLNAVPCGDHLLLSKITDIAKLQVTFSDMFLPLPGHTHLIEHHIEILLGVVVCSCTYYLHKHKKNVIQDDFQAMFNMGVIEESHSD